VSSGIGVGLAAVALALSSLSQGHGGGSLSMLDFHVALGFTLLLALAAVLFYSRMSPQTGMQVTGHRPR
jgi:uncharacterized membrane protein YGL010W